MNYEQDIEIDGESLDLEWIEQPKMMLKYTQHLANVKRELEECKQALDIAKAEADKKIRTEPEKFGIEKVTEVVVANAILNEKGYKKAYTEFLEAKFEVDMSQGAVNAFEHRKAALENLVKLYGQQYFAGPKAPLEITREWSHKEEQREMSRKISSKLKRKIVEDDDDD